MKAPIGFITAHLRIEGSFTHTVAVPVLFNVVPEVPKVIRVKGVQQKSKYVYATLIKTDPVTYQYVGEVHTAVLYQAPKVKLRRK
jgi:hypothetical protein